MELVSIVSLVVNVAVVIIFVALLLVCLKIKTTKKTPELLGTVGTVKTFGDDGLDLSLPPSLPGPASTAAPSSPPSLNTSHVSHRRHGSNNVHNVSGPLVVIPAAPSPGSLGNNNNCATSNSHSPAPSPYYPEHRTPSRAGERKLPDIPRDSDNGSMSELYDTLGPAVPRREASDSETETDGARANHPYARVKKRTAKEHPYATVTNQRLSHEDGLLAIVAGNEDHLHSHHHHMAPPPPPPTVHPPPAPPPENAAVTHFSGDSQDSSKGYTSISVREPLCHIQPPITSRSTIPPSRQNATYVAMSEASDDMYAAIDDPTYIPTGGISQTNSDTYAVINLPDYDSGSQTYQKLDGPEEDDEDLASPAHTYSKIDRSKKKRASAPPPPLPPPHHPAPSHRPLSFNVDDMYAKVQKSPPASSATLAVEDSLPVGASAMREAERSARARSGHWADPATSLPTPDERRVRRGEVNYSDYEVSHFDLTSDPRRSLQPSGSPRFRPIRNRSSIENIHHPTSDRDGGYETVHDSNLRSEHQIPPGNPHGYEQVVEYWLRRPPGAANAARTLNDGYDVVGAGTDTTDVNEKESTTNRLREHGYETVAEKPHLVGYPPNHRHPGVEPEPPYAVLRNGRGFDDDDDDDESEEGYETIPANERQRQDDRRLTMNDDDPGYESVRKKESVMSYGYEVISSSKSLVRRQSSVSSNKRDPGYETVKSRRETEHDYETLATAKKSSAASTTTAATVDFGYETVPPKQQQQQHYDLSNELRSLPPQFEGRHHHGLSMPLPPQPTAPAGPFHPPAARSISLSPKLGPPPPPLPPPDQLSPSIRMAVRPTAAAPPRRPPRRSSVTVIELRNDDSSSRQSSPDVDPRDVTDDDETVHSGGEGTEVNTHIFV